MDEFKMWAINGTQATPVSEKNMTDSEEQLEEILVNNSDLLMPNLTLVARQMETGAGPLDLMGVDSDGRLVLFELKRDKPARVAVAQVIDYASALEAMGVDRLATHIANSSGSADGIDKIENFAEWHEERYPDVEGIDALLPMRMFLVGLGVKDGTERMVNFLANKSVDISLLTFQGFEQADGQMMLMRVKADADSVPGQPQSQQSQNRLPEAILRAQVLKRAEEGNLLDLISDVSETFLMEFNHPNEGAHPYVGANTLKIVMRVRYRVPGINNSTRALALIEPDPQQEQVRIIFREHHVRWCPEAFRPLLKEENIRYDPEDYAPESPSSDIHFLVNEEEWETHKDKLTALAQAVYSADIQGLHSGRSAWDDIGTAQ